MPIHAYHGSTFVAFVDISGFKDLMKNQERALKALSAFFQTGYNVLSSQSSTSSTKRIEGLLVSDCGILFSRCNEENDIGLDVKKEALASLLIVIEQISKELLSYDLMLTTSIAYGRFDYYNRAEFSGIAKNLIIGSAYLNAYLENEMGKPKLNPGQCRILLENLDAPFIDLILDSCASPLSRVKYLTHDRKRMHFYWMVGDPDQIESFISSYRDTHNLDYKSKLEVLKRYSMNI